jgi:hypothetical protein
MSARAAFLALALVAFTGTATAQAAPPTISSAWVTDVTATSATLRAKVNPEGSTTTYRFQYLMQAAYEANLMANPKGEGFEGASLAPAGGPASGGSGSTPVAVANHIASLASLTAYRYRPVASNSSGTTIGPMHVLTTEAPTNASGLLDDRGWEMVSPVDKGGGAIAAPGALFGGGEAQAAAAGSALTYSSAAAFGETLGSPPVSQYLSQRGKAGWSTENVSGSLEAGAYGDHPDGSPYRLFAADLSRGLMLDPSRCAAEGTCSWTYSLWEGSAFTALPKAAGLRLKGASADLHHVVFATETGLYEWNGGALETVAAVPGAALAGPIGAVSTDGSHVYFAQGEDGPLRMREMGGAIKTLPETTGTGATFQAASASGALAYYTAAGVLYRFDAVSSSSKAIASGVKGVLAVSPGGEDVYYQDTSGLERWHEGAVTTIVAGVAVAASSDYPPATATARVSADGAHLAFLSAASIPPFDNIDAKTETPDTELYLYGASPGGGPAHLLCVSCNPTGERPAGSASIPGAQANGSTLAYRPRPLSADGGRLFFDSADKLVAGDTDSATDAYEWEAQGEGNCTRAGGCLELISGGHTSGGRFLDASEDGADAFILTEESLLGSDPGSVDVYDARVGGGFVEPKEPIPCTGDSCQALPPPPEDPSPGTMVPNAGNPAPRYYGPGRKHHKHKNQKRKRRHRRAKRAGGKR